MTISLTRRAAAALIGATALTVPLIGRAAPVSAEDERFAKIASRWLEAYLNLQPIGATQTGDHRFDGEIDDMSAAGRGVRLAAWKSVLKDLDALDRAQLSRDNQADAAILANELRRAIWEDETLQSWAWDPQVYSSLAGDALYTLMAREFAPLPDRLRSAIARMERLPRLLAEMRANLVAARVPPVHATTAARQNSGVTAVVDSMILPPADALSPADRARLTNAAVQLKAAVAEHQTWLDKTLLPNARGDFRIGARLFDEKLAFTLNSPLSRKEIRAKADAAVIATRARMYEVSRRALAGRADAPAMPDAPTPEQQQAAIEAALDLAYAQKPAKDKVIAACTEALGRATDFVKANGLITLPDAPVEVVTMPEFAQGVAVAYCDAPGPLDKNLRTYFDVSPIPADWTAQQADSFLREYNLFGIQDVAVHEAMPGHFVQLWHANQCPSMVRAVLGSGSFIEGWAVYAEGMMVERGFRRDEPLYELAQLKVLLRTITNAILDQAVHVDGITQEEAMKLMTVTAFQQEREASGKWTRASLSSTQLSTYFVGVSEHDAIRADYEKRSGAAFDLKTYHDKVLSYGSAPARYVRALMFDEAIG
ncbi:MAG TPA: DUF885 domain-containing protein [Rhizomicrobium sp.]|nr:DUF885 domain-containing protein [Rhizomicrobium sp.]